MDRKIYVFAYDISDSTYRTKVHDLLTGYAIGKQKSLCECLLTPTELVSIREQVTQWLQPGDKMHYVHLPENSPSYLLGIAKPLRLETFLIV